MNRPGAGRAVIVLAAIVAALYAASLSTGPFGEDGETASPPLPVVQSPPPQVFLQPQGLGFRDIRN
jgi:hypothetical protein